MEDEANKIVSPSNIERAINTIFANLKTIGNMIVNRTNIRDIISLKVRSLFSGVSIQKVVVKAINGSTVTYKLTLAKHSQTNATKDDVAIYAVNKTPSNALVTGLAGGQITGTVIDLIASVGALGYLFFCLLKRRK